MTSETVHWVVVVAAGFAASGLLACYIARDVVRALPSEFRTQLSTALSAARVQRRLSAIGVLALMSATVAVAAGSDDTPAPRNVPHPSRLLHQSITAPDVASLAPVPRRTPPAQGATVEQRDPLAAGSLQPNQGPAPPPSISKRGVRAVPAPRVTGPITAPATWGVFHNQSFFSVEPFGFVDQEFFIEGDAKAYVVAAADAAYKTRIQVIRPAAPRRFNGTVIVEWLNTSSGQDLAGQWLQLHQSILREGYAWVGVSAQSESTASLATWDPARYGSLRAPGYWHMFDIFNQAVQSTLRPAAVRPLGPLKPKRVIATGVSQSAVRLDEYLDFGVDADVLIVDGFLIERNVDSKASYAAQRVPVVNIASEESTRPVAETSGPNWRLWQVAGAAHVDHWFVEFWRAQLRNNNQNHAPPQPGAERVLADRVGKYGESPTPAGAVCGADGNLYPSRYVSANALAQLQRWVAGGAAAISVPPLRAVARAGPSGSAITRDEAGNAIGGYRLPVTDVALVAYRGNTCGLSGSTHEAPAGYLESRYSDAAGYRAALRASLEAAVAQGRLLPTDADDLWRRAQTARVSPRGIY